MSPIGHELLEQVNDACHLGVDQHSVPLVFEFGEQFVQDHHLATIVDHRLLVCVGVVCVWCVCVCGGGVGCVCVCVWGVCKGGKLP